MPTSAVRLSLSASQQAEVVVRTGACLRQAERIFNRPFADIPIRFDLTGRAAGMFCFRQRQSPSYWFRYNPQVFAVEFAQHCADTAPHEVAHYVNRLLHPNAAAHGPEWKRIARLLGARPRATGRYSLEGVALRCQQRYAYVCACQTHQLTTQRHRRVEQGARYVCKQCRTPLRRLEPPAT